MFNREPVIGLDIGSKKIKLVQVKKGKKGLQVVKFASISTPPGMVQAGIINAPEELGKELGKLVSDLQLNGKSVVSAVSGQQLYTRTLIMPKMKLEELKEAVFYQAANFLPIPIEEAATDVFPLRDFEDERGKKTEVFFVAVRQYQVDSLVQTCHAAGLKLKAIDIEPLAIYRLLSLSGIAADRSIGILNMGASGSSLSVFRKDTMNFYRFLSFGCEAFLSDYNFMTVPNFSGLDQIEIEGNNQYDYLISDILAELLRSIEYYTIQHNDTVDAVYLIGGGSRLKGLDEKLASGIEREVLLADTLSYLTVPENLNSEAKRELQCDFSVALGLAARGIIK